MLKKPPVFFLINIFLVRQLGSLDHSSCSLKNTGYRGLKASEV